VGEGSRNGAAKAEEDSYNPLFNDRESMGRVLKKQSAIGLTTARIRGEESRSVTEGEKENLMTNRDKLES